MSNASTPETAGADEGSFLIDEFDIIELEDRLELGNRCNGNCGSDTQLT